MSIVKKKTDHEKINTKKYAQRYYLQCTRKRIIYGNRVLENKPSLLE
jgi:hypothetical protein